MILYLLNLADLASTFYALSIGLAEGNPIGRFILEVHPMLAVFIKVVPMFFLCWYLAKCAKASRGDAIVYWIVVGVYAFTVVWNITHIIAVSVITRYI